MSVHSLLPFRKEYACQELWFFFNWWGFFFFNWLVLFSRWCRVLKLYSPQSKQEDVIHVCLLFPFVSFLVLHVCHIPHHTILYWWWITPNCHWPESVKFVSLSISVPSQILAFTSLKSKVKWIDPSRYNLWWEHLMSLIPEEPLATEALEAVTPMLASLVLYLCIFNWTNWKM